MGQGVVEAQFGEEGWAVGDVDRIRNRCGRHWDVVTREHGARPVIVAVKRRLRIGLQGLEQRVVQPLREGLEAARDRCGHGVRPALF